MLDTSQNQDAFSLVNSYKTLPQLKKIRFQYLYHRCKVHTLLGITFKKDNINGSISILMCILSFIIIFINRLFTKEDTWSFNHRHQTWIKLSATSFIVCFINKYNKCLQNAIPVYLTISCKSGPNFERWNALQWGFKNCAWQISHPYWQK